ncbi:T9SS type A sorting domain-containing protein [Flavobacterium sp.]|uniref:T9SS type A sorting domain-containing protein n=1 Tax=Flavobacterium sp. TaxID=239 RepID=UPI0037B8A1AC
MKKIYLILLILGAMNTSFAQKTSTVFNIGTSPTVTVKFDLNNATSKVQMTLTGPDNSWLGVGINSTGMANYDEYVILDSASTLSDYTDAGDTVSPNKDLLNTWTVTSNTTSSGIRTVVANRPFVTADPSDYKFVYNTLTSLNVIAAYGPGTFDITQEHANKNLGTVTFSALGVEDFASLDKISLYPNPSNGVFTITKNSTTTISKISIYDANAKLLKDLDVKAVNENGSVNLSELSIGIYFMEISNDTDKTVKKIIIK